MFRRRLLPVLALTVACLQSCTAWRERQNVLISSDPMGAHIYVDGEHTGHTTPHRLAIGGNFGTDHVVRLEKPGFRPARRTLYQHTEGYTSKWIDGAYDVVLFPLPFFWTTGDFLLPFGIRGALLPAELHVQLQRTDEPLLGFDLLAARREEQDPQR
jgi:hypothetical protein